MMPPEDDTIPEDGICCLCNRLVRHHPGVEKALAIRGLQYFDGRKGRVVRASPIPYCTCKEKKEKKE